VFFLLDLIVACEQKKKKPAPVFLNSGDYGVGGVKKKRKSGGGEERKPRKKKALHRQNISPP